MTTIDLVGPRKWLFLISGLMVAISIGLLLIPPALKPGIEFTSGTTMHLRFAGPALQDDVRDEFARIGHEEARVQSTGAGEFLIRTRNLETPEGSFVEVVPTAAAAATATPSPTDATVTIGRAGATGDIALRAVVGGDPCRLGIEAGKASAGATARVVERFEDCASGATYRVQIGTVTGFIAAADTRDLKLAATPAAGASATPTPVATPAAPRPQASGERGEIEAALQARFGDFEVLEFSTVSPVISQAAVRNATVAVIVSSLFIMGYIAFAFATVPRPFRYAVCAIVATLHDAIVVLGAFSLLGKLFGIEVNLMFITGLLTIIGFSVHDTIVVFDRIRENIRLAPAASLHESVNAALLQTLARSFNTSITVLLTVAALLLLGGASIQSFLLVLLVGVVVGMYSSIAVAAQLLVAWEDGDFGRLRDRLTGRVSAPAEASGR